MWLRVILLLLSAAVLLATSAGTVVTQAVAPTTVDPDLAVRTEVSGLNQPTSMAFIDDDEILVLEKASGRVLRVAGGVVQGTVLDLAVNSASERGLLGMALHPRFPNDSGVYLYWTESSTGRTRQISPTSRSRVTGWTGSCGMDRP